MRNLEPSTLRIGQRYALAAEGPYDAVVGSGIGA